MAKFNTLDEFLASIDDPINAQKISDLLDWIKTTFPSTALRIAWNQPMVTDHDTFVIGFSAAKNHFSVAVETNIFETYLDQIKAAGYKANKKTFQIQWSQEINLKLLQTLIAAEIEDKKDVTSFWK